MKADCIEGPLARLYYAYGRWLAKHPLFVLAVSVVVTVILGAGFTHLEYESDAERLFTPNHSDGKLERELEETYFNGTNTNGTLANRLTRTTATAVVIFVIKDPNKNIIGLNAIRDILRIDQEIKDTVRSIDNRTYGDLCLTFYNHCPTNDIIDVFRYINSSNRDVNLKYPEGILDNSKPYFIGSSVGGVRLENGTRRITNAVAIRLYYPLSGVASSNQWEEDFMRYIEEFQSKEIVAYGAVSSSLSTSLDQARTDTNPQIVFCIAILVIFSVLSSTCSGCTKADWVQNKPILAFMGVVSAGLATLSTIGLMGYFGVKFNVLITATPVLVLSVGVDDMFILLAAWRKTSIRASIEKRMGKAMQEAALSITITSLTNTLAFGFGYISPFPAVQAFCLYTGVAVMFDFAYQVTFFSAFMVLTGKRERANRHALTFKVLPLINKSPSTVSTENLIRGRNIGGQEKHPHVIMNFFRDVYGEFLMKKWTKLFILFIYIAYISIAILYMIDMKIGIERRLLAPRGSSIASYYTQEAENFNLFGSQICIYFDRELNYWNRSIQENIEQDINGFERSSVFHTSEFTTFWLRDYLRYLQSNNYQVNGKDDFMHYLVNRFLVDPRFKQYNLDIVFNARKDEIIASRAYVSSKNINNADREQDLTQASRDLAEASTLPMHVFAPDFIYYDQYFFILPNTLKNMIYAAGAMLVISILLIPRPLVSVWVVLTIASIEIGVLGFMTLWNINLDFQSSIFVTLTTGFSVDFSVHIAYTYAVAPYKLGNNRTIYALYSVGMPMLQGGLSTVLGLLALCTASTYIIKAVFKIIFLVTVIGVIHGLVFLPVILSVLGSCKTIRQCISPVGVTGVEFEELVEEEEDDDEEEDEEEEKETLV